jgi:hypothetical protein
MVEMTIENPADLIHKGRNYPIDALEARRDQDGQIREVLVFFDPACWARLKSAISVLLDFPRTGDRMVIGISQEPCLHPDDSRQDFVHLHSTELDRPQAQTIEKFLQTFSARQDR